MAAEMSGSVL